MKQIYTTLLTLSIAIVGFPAMASAAKGTDIEPCKTFACVSARYPIPKANPAPERKKEAKKRASKKSTPTSNRHYVSASDIAKSNVSARESEDAVLANPQDNSATEANVECNSIACLSKRTEQQNPILSTIQMSAATLQEISERTSHQAESCEMFASETSVKKWGKVLRENLHLPSNSALYKGSDDFHRLCPNYDNMDADQRDGLFLIFFSNFAMSESTCNPGAKLGKASKGHYGAPNGTAYGLFQMHLGKEDLLTPVTKVCKVNDSRSPERSIKCIVAHLNERVMFGNNVFSPFHFQVLYPNDSGAKKNMAAMRNYEFCKRPNASLKLAKK